MPNIDVRFIELTMIIMYTLHRIRTLLGRLLIYLVFFTKFIVIFN